MLSILLNPRNYDAKFAHECVNEFGAKIGMSASLTETEKEEIANETGIELYDTGLFLDSDNQSAFENAFADAARYGVSKAVISTGSCCDVGNDETVWHEKLTVIKEAAASRNLGLLLTNRREFVKECPVSADKFMRLVSFCQVGIAYDFGFAHAYGTALENLYDWLDSISVILLNDNFGLQADNQSHDWINKEIMYVDEQKQPGYGNAPLVGMAKILRKEQKDIPLFINGGRQGNADLQTILIETRTILGGRVFISPAQARIGRNETGRIII